MPCCQRSVKAPLRRPEWDDMNESLETELFGRAASTCTRPPQSAPASDSFWVLASSPVSYVVNIRRRRVAACNRWTVVSNRNRLMSGRRFRPSEMGLGPLSGRPLGPRSCCSECETDMGGHGQCRFVDLKNDVVVASPAVANRDVRAFGPDADVFRPQRFREGAETGWDTQLVDHVDRLCNMISFGGGAHTCSGRRFAVLQISCVYAILLRKFDFELLSAILAPDPTAMVVGPGAPILVRYRKRD